MLRSRSHGANDRASNLSFRIMTWMFRLADFFFPKHDRLATLGIQPGFTVVLLIAISLQPTPQPS